MSAVRERSRARAEQVLDREYDALRADTLRGLRGKLAARGQRFDDTDLEAFYNQAWHGLYLKLADGEAVDNHTGFLVNAAYFRAIEELRRLRPEQRADTAELAAIGTEIDVDGQLDDHTQLTQFMEGMRDRLTERERQAATLCYIHGCTRPQTAEALGVSPKRMEKLMDGVSRKIGVLVADIRDGSWCESRDSLMKAYAFGVLDPDGERWKLASEHLRECPGCRRYVRGLRGIAAVAPPIGLPMAALALLGGGAAGGAAATSGAAGSGGAGAAGGTAGGTAGSGSAGGAAGGAASGGGGFGATGAVVAATAVVAAAGLGAFAIVKSGEDPKPQPARAVPAATTPAAPASASAPAAAAKPKAATKKKQAKAKKPAAAATPAPGATPAAAPADSAASTPAAQQPAAPKPTPAAPEPAPQAEAEPTTDGAQEFGFEEEAP